jgi:hypothetical protein
LWERVLRTGAINDGVYEIQDFQVVLTKNADDPGCRDEL